MQRCNIEPTMVPRGAGCVTPGSFNEGCIYEIAWESLGLTDTTTDATLKHVPRSGTQVVLDFHVDLVMVDWAATGAAGGMDIAPSSMTALTVNSKSMMPVHNSNSGAGLTSNVYSLSLFARELCQNAGGCLASLASGDGTGWAQFGVHMIPLGIQDDVTITIRNDAGQTVDAGGTLAVLQLSTTSARVGKLLDDAA